MDFLLKEQYSMEDLLEIVRILRAPGGCPWDQEQTHQSIRANFIEETYEAIEAIDTNDLVLLQEELGDVLLQILLHTQMEAEHGGFTFADVVDGIAKKLIVRHPHVFGETVVKDSAEVLSNWDEIKKQTKDQKTQTQVLRSVSPALPALMRSAKVQKKACKAGEVLPASPQAALQAVEQHVQQVRQAVEHPEGNVQKAVGDLLFSVVNVARTLTLEPEHTLNLACDRFIDAFEAWEQKTHGRNGND